MSPSNIIYRRYLLPITQNKVNVGGKFRICFVKCRKDRKIVYYIDVERKGRCKKKAIIWFTQLLFVNYHWKCPRLSIKLPKFALNSHFSTHNALILQFVCCEYNLSPREQEAGAASNVSSCRLHVCTCEKCWQFNVHHRKNNSFIQLSSGYPLLWGQKNDTECHSSVHLVACCHARVRKAAVNLSLQLVSFKCSAGCPVD